MMAKEVRVNKLTMAVLMALGLAVSLYVITRVGRRGYYADEYIRLSELLSASIELAERGGERVVAVRKMKEEEVAPLAKGLTKEGKKEFVTVGDKQSHQVIVSGLRRLWPSLPLQSEENDMPLVMGPAVSLRNPEVLQVAQRDEAVPLNEVTVWVDPLDATQEYTEGKDDPSLLRFVTVMVCIAVRGYPVAGVIHQPFSGVTNWGWVNHGVSRTIREKLPQPSGGKPGPLSPGKVKVIYSRSHAGAVSSVAHDAFQDQYTVEDVVAAGSGFKVLQVVTGQADMYLHTTAIKKWDICAGDALLNAVGGRMSTLRDQQISYTFDGSALNEDGILAAVPVEAQRAYLGSVRTSMAQAKTKQSEEPVAANS